MQNTIENITPEELQILKATDKDCQIIDVREQAEYETFKISGSKLIPLSVFDQNYKPTS